MVEVLELAVERLALRPAEVDRGSAEESITSPSSSSSLMMIFSVLSFILLDKVLTDGRDLPDDHWG